MIKSGLKGRLEFKYLSVMEKRLYIEDLNQKFHMS